MVTAPWRLRHAHGRRRLLAANVRVHARMPRLVARASPPSGPQGLVGASPSAFGACSRSPSGVAAGNATPRAPRDLVVVDDARAPLGLCWRPTPRRALKADANAVLAVSSSLHDTLDAPVPSNYSPPHSATTAEGAAADAS